MHGPKVAHQALFPGRQVLYAGHLQSFMDLLPHLWSQTAPNVSIFRDHIRVASPPPRIKTIGSQRGFQLCFYVSPHIADHLVHVMVWTAFSLPRYDESSLSYQ